MIATAPCITPAMPNGECDCSFAELQRYIDTDRQKTNEINILTKENRALHAEIKTITSLARIHPIGNVHPIGTASQKIELRLPPDLHRNTQDLVILFSEALARKLKSAQDKYGYSDGWMKNDWRDECKAKLSEHVVKGDPRDVAAYCAFAWHHNWSVEPSGMVAAQTWRNAERYRFLRNEENWIDNEYAWTELGTLSHSEFDNFVDDKMEDSDE